MKKLIFILISVFTLFAQNSTENFAVMDLQNRGMLNTGEIKLISDIINSILIENYAFNVIERGQIDDILKEQGFQLSGACDEKCMVQAGQLLSVSRIIGGSIGKLDDVYILNLKIVDVATGKIIAQVSKDYKMPLSKLIMRKLDYNVFELFTKAGYTPPPKMARKKINLVKKDSGFEPKPAQVKRDRTAEREIRKSKKRLERKEKFAQTGPKDWLLPMVGKKSFWIATSATGVAVIAGVAAVLVLWESDDKESQGTNEIPLPDFPVHPAP
jgi:hypothetical protein